jgi:hypothetical protein
MVTCHACEASVPIFEFELESDAGAMGLCSACKCNDMTLVIAEVSMSEWLAMQNGELSNLPERIIGFEGFHVLHVKRIERSPDPPLGISFSEYRKIYKSPIVVYSCPCCRQGESIKERELTIAEFKSRGGQIVALGGLTIDHVTK